jgi:hypothetical protein
MRNSGPSGNWLERHCRQRIIKPISGTNQAPDKVFRSSPRHASAHLDFRGRKRPEETMTQKQTIDPVIDRRRRYHDNEAPLLRCPITGYPCEGDLSHLCEDYGCARKGGLSPHSEENL